MNLAKRMMFFVAMLALVASCTPEPEGEKAEVADAVGAEEIQAATGEAVAVNTASSVINWTGTKVGGQHTGTIKLSEGALNVDGDKLTGGSFTIDMNSIEVTDLEGDKKGWLEGHLKGIGGDDKKDDFFNVKDYPTATFQITGVEAIDGGEAANHKITGNLTMKSITKSISFDALVTIADGAVTASTPNFTIDRTLWKIMYNSKQVLSADKIKEGFIHDEFSLAISLEAGAAGEAATDEETD